jgi:hypothetical protein
MNHTDVETAINRIESLFPKVDPPLRAQFEQKDPGDWLLDMCLSESRDDLIRTLHKYGYKVKTQYMEYLDRRLSEMEELIDRLPPEGAKGALKNISYYLVLHDDEATAKGLEAQIRVHAEEKANV